MYTIAPSPTAGGAIDLFRPEIPIRVIGQTGDAFLHGLLDTGADEVVLPRHIADQIGVVIDENVTWAAEGFTGDAVRVVLGRLTIEVSDGIETHCWPSPVAVVEYQDPDQEEVILGRTGFLEYFNTEFRGADHEVVLEPSGRFPGS